MWLAEIWLVVCFEDFRRIFKLLAILLFPIQILNFFLFRLVILSLSMLYLFYIFGKTCKNLTTLFALLRASFTLALVINRISPCQCLLSLLKSLSLFVSWLFYKILPQLDIGFLLLFCYTSSLGWLLAFNMYDNPGLYYRFNGFSRLIRLRNLFIVNLSISQIPPRRR